MNKTQDIYHQGAELYAAQYDALSFEQVHQSWQPYWPQQGLVLDIGAGSGRDALWLMGLSVYFLVLIWAPKRGVYCVSAVGILLRD